MVSVPDSPTGNKMADTHCACALGQLISHVTFPCKLINYYLINKLKLINSKINKK